MSGLSEEFPGRVQTANVDATTPEAMKEIAALGFAHHGLVIRSARDEVVFKQPDHSVDIDQVRQALREMVGR